MATRMPFKYGIATLTALPHMFVSVTLEVDGRTATGIAADGLAPKWFTKDPDSLFENEIADMFGVIANACSLATEVGPQQLPPACGARQLSKLKRFLTTLIQFGSDISVQIGERVRSLVLALVVSILWDCAFLCKPVKAISSTVRFRDVAIN